MADLGRFVVWKYFGKEGWSPIYHGPDRAIAQNIYLAERARGTRWVTLSETFFSIGGPMQPDKVQVSLSPELEARLDEMEQESIKSAVMALLRSRKFLLALFGVLQTVVAHYFELPVEVWGAIDTLVLAVIAGIAYEDGAEKRAG